MSPATLEDKEAAMQIKGMTKDFRGMKFVRTGVILVAITAASLFLHAFNQREGTSNYLTGVVIRGAIQNAVTATGTAEAEGTVEVGTQVSGQIKDLFADYNSVVKKGQLLAKIDPRNVEAQVEDAKASVAAAKARVRMAEAALNVHLANVRATQANLEAAQIASEESTRAFERTAGLFKSGLTSQKDYDSTKASASSDAAKYRQAQASVDQLDAQLPNVQAQIEQAQAQVAQVVAALNRAQINLEYTDIRSPVDGIVISRNVDIGQTVAASLQAPVLFVIAKDLTRMQVSASVDEADIGKIAETNEVNFTVDAYPSETFAGEIKEIRLEPQTIQNVVTYKVIISIGNPELKLKPGMTANITFTVQRRDAALGIPNAALRYTPSGTTPQNVGTSADRASSGKGQGRQNAAIEDAQPGTVWVLNAQGTPEPKRVALGITNGIVTELLSQNLEEGAAVIIGDTAAAATRSSGTAKASPLGFTGGAPRGGGPR